jgi:hypothetical protein
MNHLRTAALHSANRLRQRQSTRTRDQSETPSSVPTTATSSSTLHPESDRKGSIPTLRGFAKLNMEKEEGEISDDDEGEGAEEEKEKVVQRERDRDRRRSSSPMKGVIPSRPVSAAGSSPQVRQNRLEDVKGKGKGRASNFTPKAPKAITAIPTTTTRASPLQPTATVFTPRGNVPVLSAQTVPVQPARPFSTQVPPTVPRADRIPPVPPTGPQVAPRVVQSVPLAPPAGPSRISSSQVPPAPIGQFCHVSSRSKLMVF